MRLKYKWIFTLLVALSVQFSFAQEKTVTGVVSDASGTLPGANVVVQGTKTSTQTDINGKYSIKAKAGDVLVFSFVGLSNSTAKVGAGNVYDVKLGSQELSTVVVTALGIKKSEKAIGYASQTLKGTSLTEAREGNLVNALSGKVAGVQITNSSGAVGASSRIVLRGASSLTGDNSPLFVVDGVPFDNSTTDDNSFRSNANSSGGRDIPNGISSINPDDIDTMTVLKGPNAAALYGLRASKGVIIITTKSGKNQKGLGISFNSNITFATPLELPKYQNSYGQSGISPNYFQYVDGGLTNVGADGTDESWGPALDKGYSFVQWDSFKYGGAATPWISHPNNVKDFLNTGVTTTNSIALSGGNDSATFRFSVSNTDQTGMIPYTDFAKFSVTGNGNLKLGQNLTGGLSVGYYNDSSSNLPTGGYDNENVFQQFIWSARNVNFKDLKDWRNFPLSGNGTPLNWNNIYQNNPYWVLETNKNTFDKDRINGAFNLALSISNSLKLTGKVSIDNFNQFLTGNQAVGTNSSPAGSYFQEVKKFKEINGEIMLNYNKNITDNIGFNINIAGNQMARKTSFFYGGITALQLPNFYNLSNNKTGSTPIYENKNEEQIINSAFAFGQLSYKNIFYVDFTGRNDWASVLPKANNSFFYPSVTASLMLSELFDTKKYRIDYLKLRGGWAKVGSLGAITPYRINTTYALQSTGYGSNAIVPNSIFNSNAKPEATTSVEFGFDLNAFNNRLRIAATYYNSKGIDLLLPLPVSRGSGFSTKWSNDAEIINKGIELSLGGTILRRDDFSFDIDLNFAKNRNEVVTLGDGIDSQIVSTNAFGLTVQNRPGHKFGDLVGFGYNRDVNGNVIFINGLPSIDSTAKVIGNFTPDWTGGANFSIKYKGFDFNTLIDAKVGGDIYSQSYTWGRTAGTLEETLIGRETGIIGNGVKSDGAGGYVTNDVVIDAKSFNQASYNQNLHESSIFDASYVKLRQIVVGYTFPKTWLRNTFINDFKISAVARNVAILYKKVPHIDPETGFSNATGQQGQEFGQLPSARNIGLNINLKF